MHTQILKLTLKNYRNHIDRVFEFQGKTTMIVGANGIGKTNIIEAINALATTKGYRAAYDRDLIAHDENYTFLEGIIALHNLEQSDDFIQKDSLTMTIEKRDMESNTSNKKLQINKVAKTHANFHTKFSTVLFAPEDIEIITGSPAIRRRYIDTIMAQTSAEYRKAIIEYNKILKQRNKLLEFINKTANYGIEKQISFWNDKLVETGSKITEQRKTLFQTFQDLEEMIMHSLDPALKLSTRYIPNVVTSELLREKFHIEIAAKRTLFGPHRDDFEIKINNFDASKYGSRGQQRTVLTAIKLLEIEFITRQKEQRPVLLLDDIFSELDEIHKKALYKTIGKQQTIITSTHIPKIDINEEMQIIGLG